MKVDIKTIGQTYTVPDMPEAPVVGDSVDMRVSGESFGPWTVKGRVWVLDSAGALDRIELDCT
jgi:hypothetical protein